jgi:hypothetical protein
MKPDDPRLALFRDLMRLWTKHGPERFADLLKILNSGQAMEDIIQVLEAFQNAPKPKKKAVKKSASTKAPAKNAETKKEKDSSSGLQDWSEVIMQPDKKTNG